MSKGIGQIVCLSAFGKLQDSARKFSMNNNSNNYIAKRVIFSDLQLPLTTPNHPIFIAFHFFMFVAGGKTDFKFGVWLIVARASRRMTKHP